MSDPIIETRITTGIDPGYSTDELRQIAARTSGEASQALAWAAGALELLTMALDAEAADSAAATATIAAHCCPGCFALVGTHEPTCLGRRR